MLFNDLLIYGAQKLASEKYVTVCIYVCVFLYACTRVAPRPYHRPLSPTHTQTNKPNHAPQQKNLNRCSLHRKMDLGELFIIDSGPFEASFIVATKAKSFVCQVGIASIFVCVHGGAKSTTQPHTCVHPCTYT